MSFSLTNPALLPFALAIAVPFLLHLLARAKPPEYPISSTWLLRRIVRESQRAQKPRDWLLLILRTLAVAALIGVFLQPRLFLGKRLAGNTSGRSIVVIVDASASMGALDGAQTRFAAARAEATAVLSDLSSDDRVNLIWLRAQPQPEFPELGYNADYLQDALRRATVTYEAGNPRAALLMAAEMLATSAGAREIYLLSDFQATNFADLELALPDDITLVTVDVAHEVVGNQALGRIRVTPNPALVGETMRVECDVANYSDEPVIVPVFLAAGEHRSRQELQVSARGHATAIFEMVHPVSATIPATVSLDAEGFAADNHRYATLQVREAVDVAIIGDTPVADAWMRAASVLGWCRPRRRSWVDLAAGIDADVILATGWTGQGLEALQAHVASGGGLILQPAAGLASTDLAVFTGADTPETTYRADTSAAMHRIQIGVADDPILRVFDDGQYGDPTGNPVKSRLLLPTGLASIGRPLMGFADGVPAIARVRQTDGMAGRVMLWNLPMTDDDASWAERQEFLPLVGEIILDMRRRAGDWQDHAPGTRVRLPMPSPQEAARIQLIPPEGEALPIRQHLAADSLWLESEPLPAPGIYTWRSGDRVLDHVVCNLPPRESDLTSLGPDALATIGSYQAADGAAITHLRRGIALWPALLAATLLLVLTEVIVAHGSERA